MLQTVAGAARRLVVRTGDGPLRPLWAIVYRLVAQVVARHLLGGHRGGSAYLRGSLSDRDARYGYSDIDLAVVVDDAAQAGSARLAVRRRWARLVRLVPAIAGPIDLAVYERSELESAVACTTLRSSDA